ncbi:MAG: helicase-exonuclease AddAB subunit AddA [Ruminococcus flavefaciens]|nr:helicase-exonuclease AddAB subunit AddA [Ruminococcus flavefaciens]
MGWTINQENAINARNSSVIVSAAAGSGKTAVLTERIIKLIADRNSGVSADRMVVVTFTNDAASELKKRLERKLRDLINENPSDSHLAKQQILLQNAKISTINSFCFELIRDNITEQGITSGFSILDETEDKVLKAQAMEDLIDYYSENEYEKLSFLYDHFCVRNMKQLTDVISEVDGFLSSVAFREKWLDTAVEEYRKDFTESLYYKLFMEKCTGRLSEACDNAQECLDMIYDMFCGITDSDKYMKTVNQIDSEYRQIKSFYDIFSSGRIPDETESETANKFSTLVQIRKTDKIEYDSEIREIFKSRRDTYKEIVREVTDFSRSPEKDYRLSAEVTRILAEMIRKYHDIVWEKKCAKNSISFDDGERLALEILAETDKNGYTVQSETARRTAEFYDIIMIDEYQDSNNKQDMIFKLISKNYRLDENGNSMYGDNVFLVGDVKQSIYRFRLANPKNFISTLKSSEPYSAESNSLNKKIFLNKNFRSSPEVIDFVNYIFSGIMSEKCGDIDYDDDEKLYFGAGAYSGGNDNGRLTHISFINDSSSDEEDENDGEEKEKRSAIKKRKNKDKPNPEAVFTAHKIAEMLKDGVEVMLENGERRKCVPSDFCILVRNNDLINKYAEELAKLGISAKGHEDEGYLKSREIAVLIDLLRIISNPLLDISMTAVMTSPMYMFRIPEVAFIKSLDREKPLFVVMLKMVNGEYDGCDGLLVKRCREFLDSLESFRLDSVTMTVGELIGRIYDTTDFISVMQLYNDGEKKRANLRTLIQYAKNYEKSVSFEGAGGLNGFLRHIDRVMENDDYKQGKVSAPSGDYVSIMTLHGSKGLEFTFVFMAENNINFKYDYKPAMCSADGRIGYMFYERETAGKCSTFQRAMLIEEGKSDTRSESVRLMYVGLTRAKQKLFINLKFNEKILKSVKKLVDKYISVNGDIRDIVCSAKNFSEWIWLCLMKHSKFEKIAEYFGLVSDECVLPEPSCSDNIFEYEICEKVEETEISDQSGYKETEADEAICSEIRRIIYDNYDSSLSEIPAKLSVTQVTRKFKEEDVFDFKLKRPAFMSENTNLTGAERGTAIHTFFQYCIFENAIKNPEDEIKRVVDMGYISKAQAEAVSPAKVRAFFESSLYGRVKNAENVWRERKFMVAVAELGLENDTMKKFSKSDGMIKGIIDLMFEEEDGIVIVDYKSDRGVSEKRLAERYTMQIQLYKSAIELTTGKRVKEAYLYSIEMEKSIPMKL